MIKLIFTMIDNNITHRTDDLKNKLLLITAIVVVVKIVVKKSYDDLITSHQILLISSADISSPTV